jgi:allophanate hydrolase
MAEPNPLTIDDWIAASASAASPREPLLALQKRLATERPAGVWIALVDRAGIEAQVASLEARASRCADAAALRRAMPLFGVPFAVKDNIDVAGLATTAACPAFRYLAAADAHAVAKLIGAGAVCVGKTNLDQFATGLVGTRSPYGRPSSTFAPERISGGSSSGSAVAVSRGDVPFALGTDTAGSGRVPAAFNNIVGLKPTPGRVSTRGVVPACRSIDCVSILTLSVVDAARVLAIVEGSDDGDAYSDFALGPAHAGDALRVGVPMQPLFSGDAGYRPAYERAVATLRELGHGVVPMDFVPLHAVADQLYGGPWVAERHAVIEALLERDPEAIEPTVRSVVSTARAMSATDAFRGLYALKQAQRDTRAIWDRVDLLMVPSAPGHPRHAEVDADPLGVNAGLGAYTNFVNLLGWCALALPAGFTATRLPFGVTFIAPHAADAALARFGARWQAHVALPLGATTRTLAALDAAGTETGAAAPIRPATPATFDARACTDPTAAAADWHWPASEETLAIAVVGAHLRGLPLNPQLVALGARFCMATSTAPRYRLFALPGTVPAKPGLVRIAEGGASIAVEVWSLPRARVGAFLASIAAPLGIGSIELLDGSRVHGFLCESHALAGAGDITVHGGWRAYLASVASPAEAAPSA